MTQPIPLSTARRVEPDDGQIQIADRFAHEHASSLRFCAELGGWLAWDGTRWKADKIGTASEAAKRFLRESAAGLDGADLARRCSRTMVEAVLALAASDPKIARAATHFDASHDEINTPAGIVDLRTGELRPHAFDPVTRVTSCEMGDLVPESFLAFLEEVQPDEKVRGYLQRLAGYAATGRATENAFACLFGSGANGKSVLVDIIAGVLGDYAAPGASSLVVETRNTHPTDVADLVGLRCVYVSETDGAAKLDATKVKSLTGGDRLKARFMRQDFFTFSPTHTLLLLTNHRPLVDASDDAIWRRIHLVPFDVVIPEARRDRDLARRIVSEEGAGVLAWIVDGARDWYERGLDAPASIRDASAAYRYDEDVVQRWIEDRCLVGRGYYAPHTQLLASFQAYAKAEGEDKRITEREFRAALDRKGYPSKKSGGNRRREGIQLDPAKVQVPSWEGEP